jgi:hypothetical protein
MMSRSKGGIEAMGFVFACGRSNGGNKPVYMKIPAEAVKRETAHAYGLDLNGEANAPLVWIPKSQISDWTVEGENVFFWLPRWLVEEKSLEYFVDTSYEPSLFQ